MMNNYHTCNGSVEPLVTGVQLAKYNVTHSYASTKAKLFLLKGIPRVRNRSMLIYTGVVARNFDLTICCVTGITENKLAMRKIR